MSANGRPPVPYPAGGQAFREAAGHGPLFGLLAPSDFFYKVWEDGFVGDAILGEYPAAKVNGASAAVTFTAGNAGGYLELVTGTADNGYAGQALTDPMFLGDVGFLAEFLVRMPASVASLKWEIGVTDATDDAGAVNAKATPTATATDFAVLCFDTDDDTTTQLIYAKAGTVAAVETPFTGFTPVADTTYYVAIRVEGDNVKAFIKAVPDAAATGTPGAMFSAGNAVAAAGLEGGNKLTPWVFAQARAGSASRTLRLYKWRVTALAA